LNILAVLQDQLDSLLILQKEPEFPKDTAVLPVLRQALKEPSGLE
jgi:hypothetical protein